MICKQKDTINEQPVRNNEEFEVVELKDKTNIIKSVTIKSAIITPIEIKYDDLKHLI